MPGCFCRHFLTPSHQAWSVPSGLLDGSPVRVFLTLAAQVDDDDDAVEGDGEAVEGEEADAEEEEDTGPRIKRFSLQSKLVSDGIPPSSPSPIHPERCLFSKSCAHSIIIASACPSPCLRIFHAQLLTHSQPGAPCVQRYLLSLRHSDSTVCGMKTTNGTVDTVPNVCNESEKG
jgi:hypothetical protein